MNDFAAFLIEVKKKNNLRFDADLARFLDLSPPYIYKLLEGRGVPSEETCVKIAIRTGENPLRVLGLARKAATASPMVEAAWDSLLKSLSKQVFFWTISGWSMVKGVTAAVLHLYIM